MGCVSSLSLLTTKSKQSSSWPCSCILLTSLWLYRAFCHTPYSVLLAVVCGIPLSVYYLCGYNQIYCFIWWTIHCWKKIAPSQNLVYPLTASTDLDVLAGSASRNWQNHKPLKCNHSSVVTSFSAGSCGSAQKPKKSVVAAQ